eukprot:TRINITY_DN50337_c0_g1_i1.p1 TRINITY_DN50337_c0_g1~~TRINITY_DN50337_c0_g1_i1.p1  ORF type:complete len:151 (-),score=17.95 TRINITY_DN50337_c0_g1_i1:145-546(-)
MDASLEKYEKAFFTDDHPSMLRLMTDDVKFSDPLGGEIVSKAALAKYLAQAGGVLTDVTQHVEDRAVQGDVVFFRWVHSGRNQVTGERYSFAGTTFVRFKGTHVVEHRDYFDPKVLVSQFVKARKVQKQKAKL